MKKVSNEKEWREGTTIEMKKRPSKYEYSHIGADL